MSGDMDGQTAGSTHRLADATREGFETWVRASSPRLRRLAYLLTGDLHDAEDLLQSAYAKVLPRWSRISSYDSPEAYMHRTMVNLRTSWWRRSRNREHPTDEIPETHRHAGAPREDDAVVESEVLLVALRALPARQRAAVVLRHWCDLSEAETAVAMSCSVGTVKSNTARGLAHLRSALTHTHDAPGTQKGGNR